MRGYVLSRPLGVNKNRKHVEEERASKCCRLRYDFCKLRYSALTIVLLCYAPGNAESNVCGNMTKLIRAHLHAYDMI